MRLLQLLVCIICGGALLQAAPLSYIGSTPANNQNVSSFDDIVLHFDLTEVEAEYGEGNWGICCNAIYSKRRPAEAKCATLYKGVVEDNDVITRLSDSRVVDGADFTVGSDFHMKFPGVQIETGQIYTLVITYEMYAGKSGETSWNTETKYSFFDNPLTLTFVGGDAVQKVLLHENWSIEENASLDAISSVSLTFNHEVDLIGTPSVSLNEGSYTMVSTSDVSVDPNDPKSVVINFPETQLYNGHNYSVVFPAGAVCVAGEPETMNEEVSLSVTGTGYRYFGTGRISPANGSETTLDDIIIPFKFPTVEGSDFSYGFTNITGATYPLKFYTGNVSPEDVKDVVPEHLVSLESLDNSKLTYKVNFALEAGQEYTLIMDEGTVKAYAIGDPRNSYLKDYISEAVELHYTTPSLDKLPKLILPQSSDIADGAVLESVETILLPDAYYDYKDTRYVLSTSSAVDSETSGILYEVLTDGAEKEVKRFKVNKSGHNVALNVNETLYKGKNYRIVVSKGAFIPFQSNFLKQHVSSEEFSLNVVGATSTESTSEFTSGIVEGQKLSHVGVVSFYTDGEVMAADNAVLEIRNGEETVASAPVRVAQEDGYSHVYADFADAAHQPFVTESGATYAAVLPQGTVVEAANGVLTNKEYSVSFVGMASEAVYHNVTLSVDNAVAQTSPVEEGKTVSFQLSPVDDLWTVESVSNASLDAQSGMYVTEPVVADVEVKAVFALVNPVDFDFTVGVEGVAAECSYRVYSENNYLVIEGVTEGDNIRIYTTGGTLMADKSVPSDVNTVSMNLADGIYIVAINGKTFKVKH